MNPFVSCDLAVSELGIAIYIPAGQGDSVHINRRYHGLCFNEDGDKVYRFENGETMCVLKNDLFYLPKHSSYTVVSNVPGGCYAINFDLAGDESLSHFVMSPRSASSLLPHFRAASEECRKKKPGYRERALASLYALLGALKEIGSATYLPPKSLQMIAPATAYIEEHYINGSISIPELARLCGISEVYLRRLFHNAYGVSPLEYVQQLRLGRAEELLRAGECSIKDAAMLAGFLDESYFSREFKKRFGKSPKKYRESLFDFEAD